MQIVKKAAGYAGIFLASFLLILIWGQFDPDAFLWDDNRTQWFPVMEKAYGDFFRTGTLPVYDFYQFKGLAAAEPGYYGIMNPIILLSYILSHFTPLPFSTLTINIALMFSAGNVCFYVLCRHLKCSIPESLLLTGGYSGISAFMSFFYWYYVYNNYLMIPLLLLTFLKGRGKKWEFCACGILLAFEILLGNVQYTCYHYMLYVVICVVYAILERKSYFGIMAANVFCGGCLSAPFLLLLLQASGGIDSGEFLAMQMHGFDLILYAFLPLGILNRFSPITHKLCTSLMGRVDFTWLYNGTFAVFWLIVILYLLRVCWKKRSVLKDPELSRKRTLRESLQFLGTLLKNTYRTKIVRPDGSHVLLLALAAVWLFFMLFITGNVVAILLNLLPVIGHFRYLFKCLFVLYPVTAVLTAAVLPHMRTRLHKAVPVVLAAVTIVGLVNNGFTADITRKLFSETDSKSISEELPYSQRLTAECMPDLNSYRCITLMLIGNTYTDSFRYYNGFLRNYPTTAGVYALAGYEISMPEERMKQFDYLFATNELSTRMLGCSVIRNFESFLRVDAAKAQEQLRSNGVKYIMVEKKIGNPQFALYHNPRWKLLPIADNVNYTQVETMEKQDYPAIIMQELEDAGIHVAGRSEWNEYYDILTLADPSGICVSENGDALPLTSERMDLLSFAADGAETYRLSFAYHKNLNASIKASDGTETALSLEPDESGNVLLRNPEHLTGTVTVSYHDAVCDFGFIMEIVLSLLLVCLLVLLCREPVKECPAC